MCSCLEDGVVLTEVPVRVLLVLSSWKNVRHSVCKMKLSLP